MLDTCWNYILEWQPAEERRVRGPVGPSGALEQGGTTQFCAALQNNSTTASTSFAIPSDLARETASWPGDSGSGVLSVP